MLCVHFLLRFILAAGGARMDFDLSRAAGSHGKAMDHATIP